MPVPLESSRLRFGVWEDSDAHREFAWRLWGDPRVTCLFQTGATVTRRDTDAKLAAQIAMAAEHRVQYWPLFEKATGDFVGCCGLRPYTSWPQFDRERLRKVGATVGPGDRDFEAGVHLVPAAWGRGYASEAMTKLLDTALSHRADNVLPAGGVDGRPPPRVRAVVAGHHPDNDASRRMLRSVGFQQVATVFYPPTGRRHPHYIFARVDQRKGKL